MNKLPGILLPYIYNEEVYRIKQTEINKGPAPSGSVELKSITVILEEKDGDLPEPASLSFLKKVIQAVRIEMNDINLLHPDAEIPEGTVGKVMIFSGSIHRNFPKTADYEVVEKESIVYFYADPLIMIEKDVMLKKRLWETLRKMFPQENET